MQRLCSPCTWTVRFHQHFNQNLVHTSQKSRQAHGTANIPQVVNCLEHTSAAVDMIFSSSKRTAVEDFGIQKNLALAVVRKHRLVGEKKNSSPHTRTEHFLSLDFPLIP